MRNLHKNDKVRALVEGYRRMLTQNVFAGAGTIGFSQPSISLEGLTSDPFIRETIYMLLQQIIGAGAPLLMFPAEAFRLLLSTTIGARLFVKYASLLTAGVVIGARLARQSWERAA